jgi:hypothetical protein
MKKSVLSKISILLSLVCIIVIIKINHDIALVYISSDGKTQALFGLVEISFYYKYYFILLSLISLIFAITGFKKREKKLINRIAFLIGLLSLIFIFLEIWRLMI